MSLTDVSVKSRLHRKSLCVADSDVMCVADSDVTVKSRQRRTVSLTPTLL